MFTVLGVLGRRAMSKRLQGVGASGGGIRVVVEPRSV